MDLTTCPECDAPAEIQRRVVLESTDGPIEHVKIACAARHWFALPLSHLARRQPDLDDPAVGRSPGSDAIRAAGAQSWVGD